MAVLTDGQMIVGDGTTDPVAESGATLRTSIGVGTGDSVTFAQSTIGKLIVGTDGATAGDVVIDNTNGGEIIWEGSTADASENKLRAADGAGVNTLPASTGTILTTAAAVTVGQGGTGATTLTDGGIILGSGTGAVTAMAVLTDGQMIVGDGTTDPVAESGATLRTSIGVGTGDSPQFTSIELGHASDSTITRVSAGVIAVEGAEVRTGTVPVNKGGTGATTLTDGGIILGSGTGAVTAMAVLTDGQMIVGDGTTDPVAESGATLRTSIGVGTGDSVTFTQSTVGKLIVGTDGATAGDVVIDNTNNGEIIWEGSSADSNENKLRASDGAGVNTLPASTGTILTTAAAITVGQGGTGATTLTDGGILLGSGTGAVTAMAALTRGQIIYGNTSGDPVALAAGGVGKILVANSNGDPSWTSMGGDATLSVGTLTIVDNAVTLAKMAGLTSGNIIVGNASNNPVALAVGSNGQVLTTDGSVISWGAAGGGASALNDLSDVSYSGGNLTITSLDTITYSNGGNAALNITATAQGVVGKNLTVTSGSTTTGGASNIAAGSLTLQGGQGKGSGAGGDIIFRVANAGSSGSTLNSYATAMTISDDSTVTLAGDLTIASGKDILMQGSSTFTSGTGAIALNGDITVAAAKKIQFRDAGLFINSSTNGQLDIDADVELEITAPTVDIAASTAVRIATPSVLITNASASKPVVEIRNTTEDEMGGELKFNNTIGGQDGQSGDDCGSITFYSQDAATNSQQYGGILCEIDVETNGQESGKLVLQVASHDGQVESGLILIGGSVDTAVDVTIGKGVTSSTTVSGDLTVTSLLKMSSNTAGKLLVGDNTSYEEIAIGGDAGLAADGTLTISNNAVTLAKMAALTRGQIIIGNSSGATAALGIGSNGQVLTSDGADISWGSGGSGASALDDLSDVKSGGTSGSFAHSLKFGDQTTGSLSNALRNISIGFDNLNAITSGIDNTCIGYKAGNVLTTSKANVFIGTEAGSHIVAQTYGYNVAVGNFALRGVIGSSTQNGQFNTAIGAGALNTGTSGATDAHNNVAIGVSCMENAALTSANNNVCIGRQTATTITSANQCVIIGYDAEPAAATGENEIVIGRGAVGLGDNQIMMGNSAITTLSTYGDIVAYYSSDRRLKDNITPIESPLEKLDKIGGYTFDWIEKEEVHSNKGRDVGVIAQEIEEVLPEVVTTKENGYKAVKYEKIVPLLIECIKEQQKQIDELKKMIDI